MLHHTQTVLNKCFHWFDQILNLITNNCEIEWQNYPRYPSEFCVIWKYACYLLIPFSLYDQPIVQRCTCLTYLFNSKSNSSFAFKSIQNQTVLSLCIQKYNFEKFRWCWDIYEKFISKDVTGNDQFLSGC